MKIKIKAKSVGVARNVITHGKTVQWIRPGYIKDLDVRLLVPHYLIHCSAYYDWDDSLIADHEFHELCQRIVHEWDSIGHHHKIYIKLDQLKVKSGKAYTCMPEVAKQTAIMLLRSCYGSHHHPEFKK